MVLARVATVLLLISLTSSATAAEVVAEAYAPAYQRSHRAFRDWHRVSAVGVGLASVGFIMNITSLILPSKTLGYFAGTSQIAGVGMMTIGGMSAAGALRRSGHATGQWESAGSLAIYGGYLGAGVSGTLLLDRDKQTPGTALYVVAGAFFVASMSVGIAGVVRNGRSARRLRFTASASGRPSSPAVSVSPFANPHGGGLTLSGRL